MTHAVGLPKGWAVVPINEVLVRLEDGRTLHQGWSPQCEPEPSEFDDVWAVLKTTAVQDGRFLPEENKRLPTALAPRPLLEVSEGDLLITCAGPRSRCGVACLVRATRPRLMISGKMYRFRMPEGSVDPRFMEAQLRSQQVQIAIDGMKTGISDSGLNLTHDRFRNLSVLVAPFPEQRHIVEAIESYLTRLDNAVALLEQVQQNLKRYRASVLKAAVEGRLVPTEAELARREGRSLPAPRPGTFYVYAIECEDGSHYIGQTDDLPRRWDEHVSGRDASWTKRNPPVRLVHWEEYDSREKAVAREKHLKTGFGRKWLKREIAAGRTRQAGYEPASELLQRILGQRKACWIEDAAEKARAKAEEKVRKTGQPWTAEHDAATLEKERAKAAEQYKEPAAPDTADLPDLPEGWCWATIEQLATDVTYGSSAKAAADPGHGVPVLRMGNIADGRVDFADLKYLGRDHEELPDLLLQRGDLLFNRTNSAELVGKSAVYNGEVAPCSFASYLIRVRFPTDVHPGYVSSFLNSNLGRRWIASVVSQQVGQANVNGTKLRVCRVPLPPRAEQERMMAEAERVLTLAETTDLEASRSILRCSRLRQSILKWAFEGRLVEQNPNDEPASVMLRRITGWQRAAKGATQ